jgi:hypothetical protein
MNGAVIPSVAKLDATAVSVDSTGQTLGKNPLTAEASSLQQILAISPKERPSSFQESLRGFLDLPAQSTLSAEGESGSNALTAQIAEKTVPISAASDAQTTEAASSSSVLADASALQSLTLRRALLSQADEDPVIPETNADAESGLHEDAESATPVRKKEASTSKEKASRDAALECGATESLPAPQADPSQLSSTSASPTLPQTFCDAQKISVSCEESDNVSDAALPVTNTPSSANATANSGAAEMRRVDAPEIRAQGDNDVADASSGIERAFSSTAGRAVSSGQDASVGFTAKAFRDSSGIESVPAQIETQLRSDRWALDPLTANANVRAAGQSAPAAASIAGRSALHKPESASAERITHGLQDADQRDGREAGDQAGAADSDSVAPAFTSASRADARGALSKSAAREQKAQQEPAGSQNSVAAGAQINPGSVSVDRLPLEAKVQTSESAAQPASAAQQAERLSVESVKNDSPSWRVTNAHRVEAGYDDPELGWVSVRAESSPSARIHAELIAGTDAAARVLGDHLDGLHQFLKEQRTAVESLSLAAQSGAAFGESAGGASQQDGRQREGLLSAPGGEEKQSPTAKSSSSPPPTSSAPVWTAAESQYISVLA